MSIKFVLEIQDLDFLATRLTQGKMTYHDAMKSRTLLEKMQNQANDISIQNPKPVTAEEQKSA